MENVDDEPIGNVFEGFGSEPGLPAPRIAAAGNIVASGVGDGVGVATSDMRRPIDIGFGDGVTDGETDGTGVGAGVGVGEGVGEGVGMGTGVAFPGIT